MSLLELARWSACVMVGAGSRSTGTLRARIGPSKGIEENRGHGGVPDVHGTRVNRKTLKSAAMSVTEVTASAMTSARSLRRKDRLKFLWSPELVALGKLELWYVRECRMRRMRCFRSYPFSTKSLASQSSRGALLGGFDSLKSSTETWHSNTKVSRPDTIHYCFGEVGVVFLASTQRVRFLGLWSLLMVSVWPPGGVGFITASVTGCLTVPAWLEPPVLRFAGDGREHIPLPFFASWIEECCKLIVVVLSPLLAGVVVALSAFKADTQKYSAGKCPCCVGFMLVAEKSHGTIRMRASCCSE